MVNFSYVSSKKMKQQKIKQNLSYVERNNHKKLLLLLLMINKKKKKSMWGVWIRRWEIDEETRQQHNNQHNCLRIKYFLLYFLNHF